MYQIDFKHPVHIYFVGIGGISMSGLAEILHHEGFTVSGSDWKKSTITEGLEAKGIKVSYGEDASHVTDDIDVAVLTSAVGDGNEEFIAIREKKIPYMYRAELLGQIMLNYQTSIAISGTHGKTTTTSMVSQVLLEADADPTLSVGGILKSIGGNLRIGSSEVFVTEACEYTNSFLSFFPKIGIILNIEEDHMDFFKDLADIRNSFRKFAQLIPADGALIINGDIPNWQEIAANLPCKVITFGMDDSSDYHPGNITFDALACATFEAITPTGATHTLKLRVPGSHNISNALATLALADELGIDREVSSKGLLHFTGTDRRFEYKGEVNGVTVIDDYAHHPTEIIATLSAAGNYPHQNLWVVFQPHTYTRTRAFLKEFGEALSLADKVVLADIYAAREVNTIGITSQAIVKELQKLGKECYYFPSFGEIEKFLLKNCINGDLLITMGAGDVHKIGENLLSK